MYYKKKSILITGATGFLGTNLVRFLLSKDFQIRIFVRQSSNIEKFKKTNVEIIKGDISDIHSLETAFHNIDYVIHAAAETKGDPVNSNSGTIGGSKNILLLSQKHNIKRLIYISSLSVYDTSSPECYQTISEESDLEREPHKRGLYSESKYKAEKIITKELNNKLQIIVLRPGIIWGPGADPINATIGIKLLNRFLIVFGMGNFILPLVYIDNLVSSIYSLVEYEGRLSGIFNVVDHTQMSKKDYINNVIRMLSPRLTVFYLPHFFVYFLVSIFEYFSKIILKKNGLTRYRYLSSQKELRYDSNKLRRSINWKEIVEKKDAILFTQDNNNFYTRYSDD